MLCFIDGVVVSMLEDGFLIKTDNGEEKVRTMKPGWKLDLAPGDTVSVMGGPGNDGSFASSSISKKLPNGESVHVVDGER